MIALRRKVDRQLVLNGVFSQPLECGLRRFLRSRMCVVEYLDMHYEGTVPRQLYGLFRHDYLSVEVGIEIKHGDELTWYTGPGWTSRTLHKDSQAFG